MSKETTILRWEWPAGRLAETKLLVRLERIHKASKGLFGIKTSPSLANALPDATDVSATVVAGPSAFRGKKIEIQIPGMNADALVVGGLAAIGLVEGGMIGICLEPAPPSSETSPEWLDHWTCHP